MKLKLVVDEFQKVHKRETPSLKLTVAGVGVEGKDWLFFNNVET